MNNSINQTLDLTFFRLSETINFYFCFVVIVIGIITNTIAIYLLTTKTKFDSNKLAKVSSTNPSSSSSSQLYMLSLALSDSLFLLSHFIEDIIPSINKSNELFQFINRSNLFCKLILFLRNSTRLSSSYLVVFFAYERFIVISAPLKRLEFKNKKFTRIIVTLVFLFSFLLTSYTLVISGLRQADLHEISVAEDKHQSTEFKFECDVIKDFKVVYDYTILVYTSLGIILPIFLVCFFNIYIVCILFRRKNRILKNFKLNKRKSISFPANLNNLIEPLNNEQKESLDHSLKRKSSATNFRLNVNNSFKSSIKYSKTVRSNSDDFIYTSLRKSNASFAACKKNDLFTLRFAEKQELHIR